MSKTSMYELFKVGDKIKGYCNGYFGREDYDEKICVMVTNNYAIFESIEGDWIGKATVLNDTSVGEIIQDWKV